MRNKIAPKQIIPISFDMQEYQLAASREYLGVYCNYLMPEFQMPAHIKLLIRKLAAVERGEIKRLIVNMPPRHGKSQLISKLFPTWFMGRNPNKNIIFTTYGQDLADNMGRAVRNTFLADEFGKVFPDVHLAKDSAAIRSFALNKGGEYIAVGAEGALTGKGGDLIIIDDPHKNRAEANSALIRGNIIDWFNSTLFTRLAPNGKLVIIQTRWHEEDLSGYLMANQPGVWEVISLPAINDNYESLWSERWPLEELQEIKKTVGSYEWSALYQQNPVPQGGAIIKTEWIREYTELPVVKSYSWSWDTAIKAGQENDYSVGQLWAECENGYYLVDLYRAKIEYPELRKIVSACFMKQKAHEVIIEDKASGQQLVQDFKRISNMPVIPAIPGKDMPLKKDERLQMVAPLFEAGKVFIPKNAEWAMDYIAEITSFPSAKHDDIVDATSQYLNRKLNQYNKQPKIRIL